MRKICHSRSSSRAIRVGHSVYDVDSGRSFNHLEGDVSGGTTICLASVSGFRVNPRRAHYTLLSTDHWIKPTASSDPHFLTVSYGTNLPLMFVAHYKAPREEFNAWKRLSNHLNT